jgi:hypothetical protein
MAKHFVEYDKYCSTCAYKDEDMWKEDHCNDCLYNPVNEDSKKPIHYKKEDTKRWVSKIKY